MATKQASRITEANGDKPLQTVAELKAANAAKCSEVCNAALKQYDCSFLPKHLVTPRGDQWEVQIVSN